MRSASQSQGRSRPFSAVNDGASTDCNRNEPAGRCSVSQRSQSCSPISRPAFVMCNRHDSNAIAVDSIEQAVRKPIQELPANLLAHLSVRFRFQQYLAHSSLNGIKERETKPGRSLLVVLRRLSHLGIGIRVEPHTFHEIAALVRRKTSSAGISFTRPSRSSFNRRSASVTQSCRFSSSEGASRLRRSFSARRARLSSPRFRTSASSSSKLRDIARLLTLPYRLRVSIAP